MNKASDRAQKNRGDMKADFLEQLHSLFCLGPLLTLSLANEISGKRCNPAKHSVKSERWL